MMTAAIAVYLTMGVMISEMVSIGHKRRYGVPLSFLLYGAGVFFWPAMLAYRRVR